MEEAQFMPFEDRPIPQELWSEYLDAPFDTCSSCGESLSGGIYEIQKVSNQRETILELACCMRCSQSLAREYSAASMESIRRFLTTHLDLRRAPDACNICGCAIAAAPTSSVWAVCSAQRLLLPVLHVCSSCEEAMQELLSQKTKDAHEDFVNRTFPGVPADLDLAPKLVI
jgi:hypothetical protein